MELRMHLARATKDIDLTITASRLAEGVGEEGERIRGLLQEASAVHFPDGFAYSDR